MDIRNLAPNTKKVYENYLNKFFYYFPENDPTALTDEQVQEFQLYLLYKCQASGSTMNQAVNAIKFYFEKVLHRKQNTYYIDRPQRDKRLPVVFSKDEIKKLLQAKNSNLKHQALLAVAYGLGLRPCEVIGLKIENIQGDRGLVHIQRSKGRKDRYVPIDESLLNLLREYYKQYKPHKWLFNGQKWGTQYTQTSMREVFKQAVRNAGILKKVKLYDLRHTFATHMLEAGVDSLVLAEIMGHNSTKTTRIYAQVRNSHLRQIKTPIAGLLAA